MEMWERDAEIVARYMNGSTYKAVAASLGMSRSAVCAVIRRRGAVGKRPPKKSSMEARGERIVPLFRAGWSVSQLANAERVSCAHIHACLRAAGATAPKDNSGRDAEIVEMCRRGTPVRQIAAAVGLSRVIVNKVLRANGVPVEGRSRTHQRNLTDQEARKILSLYHGGKKVSEIEAEYGVDLYHLRQRYGEAAVREVRGKAGGGPLRDSACSVDQDWEAWGS